MTEKEVKSKMEDAINEMHKIIIEADTENKKAYAANALSGLVTRYKEMFGLTPEQPVELKSVKSF